MRRVLHWSVLLVGVIIAGAAAGLGGLLQPVAQAAPDQQGVCQSYRVKPGLAQSVNFRACASEDCAVVGGASASSVLCVRGVAADDTDWFIVDPDPGNPDLDDAFVLGDLVEPGIPGEEDPNAYCYAHTPLSGEVVVRASPAVDGVILGDVSADEVLCVTNYAGSFIYWYNLEGIGWVDARAMEAVRNYPEGETCDNLWDITAAADVHTCAGFRCEVTRTLAPGERGCVVGEQGEEIDWVGFRYEGRTGWAYAPLLQAIPEEEIEAAESGPTAVPTVFPFGVLQSNVNVRTAPSADADIVSALREGAQVVVLALSDDGWVEVEAQSGVSGWLTVENVDLRGSVGSVPVVNAEGTTVADASALDTLGLQATATPTENVVAATEQVESLSTDLCRFYNVTVTSAVVREGPSTASRLVGTLGLGDEVCVALDEPQTADWAAIRYEPEPGDVREGFIATFLIDAQDGQALDLAATAVAQVGTVPPTDIPTADPGQPTPSPFPEIESAAATLTPTAGPCQPGQTENCYTPTPSSRGFFAPAVPEVNNVLLAQNIGLPNLNVRSFRLESPQGNSSFFFRIPDDWVMDGNNILFAEFTYDETSDLESELALSSELRISLDGQLISTLTLTQENTGEPQQIQVPLPNDLLNRNQFHRITFDFFAQDHCEALVQAGVNFNPDKSFIRYEYRESQPLLDLAAYPRPFYNSRPAVETETAVLVLPDDPTEDELQAAASIVGGLAWLTQDNVDVRVRRFSALGDFERDNFNLILVGTPERNPLLAEYYNENRFPSQYVDGQFVVNEVQIEDEEGIIQLTAHRANPNYAVMAVTGATDVALRKAAQALAGPPALLSLGGPLIVVADTQPIARTSGVNFEDTQYTLRQLGQEEDVVLAGLGQSRFDITFSIPAGTELSEDAYVDVFFNYSQLLENPSSSFNILVNEVPVGSIILDNLDGQEDVSEADNEGLRRFRAYLTPSLVRDGVENSLTFILSAETPQLRCATPDGDVVWFTISDRSILNLPRQARTNLFDTNYVGLFPQPFGSLPNLGDLWVNLPEDPTDEELNLAYRLISRVSASLALAEGIAPRVSYGALPEGTNVSDYNFILIGTPLSNPTIETFNDVMPQPFVPGTNTVEQRLDDVSFRLFPGLDFGILQKFSVPGDPTDQRKALVLTGTNELGVRDALNVLAGDSFSPVELAGDVVFVSGDAVTFVDSSRVFRIDEVLETAAELPTEQVLLAQRATEFAQATAVTLTPSPTVEPTLTPTTGPTIPPTPLVTVVPPTPTFSFEPIDVNTDPALIQPIVVERPFYVDILLYVTGGLLAVVAIGVVIRLVLRMRNREKN